MTRINLLPWREQRREEQKKQFLTWLSMVVVAVLALGYGAASFVDTMVANQEQRNRFLEAELVKLDNKIARIAEIKQAKQALEQRMALIEQLQTSRSLAPRTLDELARTVPQGLNFSRLSRKEQQLQVSGSSDSNNRLSEFMRRLEQSEVFIMPELSSIVADSAGRNPNSQFKIGFKLSPKVAPEYIQVEQEVSQ